MTKFFFLFFLTLNLFAQTEIPPLVPNVVDQANVLTQEQIETINQKISELKEKSDILAAVFIIQKLNNETIEDLSERTFRTWKLGQKGKDNGILLVLAMDDRKSRFEVGYGLEGVFTDSESRYVLDHVLAPYMRRGKVDQAIEKSLDSLLVIKSGGAFEKNSFPEANYIERLNHQSLFVYGFYLILLWGSSWVEKLLMKILIFRLRKKYPQKTIEQRELHVHDTGWRNHPFKSYVFRSIFMRLFFTINPGLFILILSAISFKVSLIILPLIFIVFLAFVSRYLKTYINLKNYEEFENAYQNFMSQISKDLKNGYIVQQNDGRLFYTPKWYASHEYKSLKGRKLSVSRTGNTSYTSYSSGSGSSWSSGSSSSSSFSSSSGGGSSGGGGSSSSW